MTHLIYLPPLSEEVDIQHYAEKLSKHACFVLCKTDEQVVGYTAYYCDENNRQLYIPLICVLLNHQHGGFGSKMLQQLIDTYKNKYNTIGLEVVKGNTKAYNFYIKHGFTIKEDRGKKFLMEKAI